MTEAQGTPRRHLGLADATAVYAGIILGSGIFVAPGAISASVPSVPAAVGLWICGAIVAACGASCYAECAARMPSNGGFFVFNAEAYGPAVAFVGGWAAIFVTYPASIAAIALVFASYLGKTTGLDGWDRPAAAAALAAAGVLNVMGLRTGPRAQLVLTSVKIAALAAVALAAVVFASRHSLAMPAGIGESPAMPPAGWLAAVMILLFTFDGWSDVTLVAGEVKNPGRNIGRAVLLGTGILALVYGLTQAAVMVVLSPEGAAASSQPVADAVGVIGGASAARAVSALVVVCTFGSILGTTFTVSRLGHAMALRGAFFSGLGRLHPKWGTPARATAALTSAAIAYALTGSFEDILAMFTFAVWIFYGITAVSLLILRRRGVGEPVSWRAPGGPVPPLVVIGVGAVMTSQLVAADPVRALFGGALLAAAFPAYLLIARSGARRR